MNTAEAQDGPLRAALVRARALGFLGPGPVDVHLRHATGFAVSVERHLGRVPASMLDLGSGAGVPGLVLAAHWPRVQATLVESGRRRAAYLRQEIDGLGWAGRVEVVEERAEVTARRPDFREGTEVVTARSFGAPAVTAEIAAGLVAPGGLLVVSEPPDVDPSRWPADELDALGFGPAHFHAIDDAHFAAFEKTHGAPSDIPRAPGRPAKRPRW